MPRARAVHPQHGHRRLDRRRWWSCWSTRATASSSRPVGTLAVIALLRVPHVVLAVNKIDLVDYDEASTRGSPRSSPGSPRPSASPTRPSRRSRCPRWRATTSSTARRARPGTTARRCWRTSRPCRSPAPTTRAAPLPRPVRRCARDDRGPPRLPRVRRPDRLRHRPGRRRGGGPAQRAADHGRPASTPPTVSCDAARRRARRRCGSPTTSTIARGDVIAAPARAGAGHRVRRDARLARTRSRSSPARACCSSTGRARCRRS